MFKYKFFTFDFALRILIFIMFCWCISYAQVSNAAQCYEWKKNTNTTIQHFNTPHDLATCSYDIWMSPTEYNELLDKAGDFDGLLQTLRELFEFSKEDFLMFNSICLVAFITGHGVGRLARIMGKV